MATLTTTLLLPLILLSPPRMTGQQRLNVVWVSTPRDTWGDTADARAAIRAGLDWWQTLADVSFETTESELTTDTDVLALNVCRERAWLVDPQPLTLYVIATSGDALMCDGVAVGDYNEGAWAIVWGNLIGDSPTDGATIAHTVAHLFGAADTHAGQSGGPTYDIMDRAVYVAAYRSGYVAPLTWAATGAVPR